MSIMHNLHEIYVHFTCDRRAMRLEWDVRSRRFPPFRLRRRRESSTLCTQGPARGPLFLSRAQKRAH